MPSKLLRNGTVLSFNESSQTVNVLLRASILIHNDRVSAIAEKEEEELNVPSDAAEVDVSGKV